MKPASITLAACLFAVPAFAGDMVSAWVGRRSFEVVADSDFRKLAGERLVKKIEPLLETGPKSEALSGRWLVVEGCRPHACDKAAAFVVIDSGTDTVLAWMTTSGKAGITAMVNPASAGTELSREVAAKLDGWRSRLR